MLTLVAETSGWLARETLWELPASQWLLDTGRLCGTLYPGTKQTASALRRRAANWSRDMATHTQDSVLTVYSDCSKASVGPKKALSYGWVTGGLVDSSCVIELGR